MNVVMDILADNMATLANELAEARAENARLRAENVQLRYEVRRMSNDLTAVDELPFTEEVGDEQ